VPRDCGVGPGDIRRQRHFHRLQHREILHRRRGT
jgi:hypothetical protein